MERGSAPGGVYLFFSVLFVLVACGGDSAPVGGESVVTDSAGIRIVDHPAALPDSPAWEARVEDGLILDEEFHQVRGALRRADGGVVVANAGTRELRFYGPDGELLRRVGRDGEGPGEFRNMALLARWPGDSLFVYDPQLRRATLFGSGGELGRSFSPETTEEVPFANVRGVHGDGSMVATGFARMGDQPPDGRLRLPSPAARYRPDGSLAGTLPVEVSNDMYYESIGGGFRFFTPIFPLSTRLLAGSGSLVEASNDTWELRIRDPSGELTGIVRRSLSPAPITDALRRRVIQATLDDQPTGPGRDDYRRALEGMSVPDHLPAYDRVAVDRLDRIWVEDYEPEPEGREATWTVLGPDGGFVARVLTSRRLEPMDIGEDWVLGVLRDDFDVETVVLAPLVPIG